MKEFLFISIILCNFAKWIGGSHEPSTRVIQQPFHFVYLLELLNVGIDMQKLTQEEVVKRLYDKWGEKFDYSKVVYVNKRTKVCVTCKEHGDFYTYPFDALKYGCPNCAEKERINHIRLTKDEFIAKAKKVHGEKYDYSETIYKGSMDKVEIRCPIHGVFKQTPNVHLRGSGCPLCGNITNGLKNRKGKENFILDANKIHNNKYSYELVPDNMLTTDNIPIICPIHGVFYQNVHSHLIGSGCPHCPKKTISKGEDKVKIQLQKIKIDYIPQYKIPNEDLFCENKNIYVDFYVPSLNTFIEYNGEQHYKESYYYGGKDRFKQQKERDMALRQYCIRHKIKLIEIPYWEFDNIETILKKELKIK